VTVVCAEAEQPLLSVPVTVYVVVEAGLAVTGEPVDELKSFEGDQEYVVAPPAVRVALCWPAHIAGGVVTVTTGSGFTVTVTCPVAVHPFEVPVTVYIVVEVGLAVTGEPMVELNPVAGDHTYVVAPVAVSDVVDCPLQIETFGETVSMIPFTVTVTCADAVHPLVVPITVYVVFVVGFAVTVEPVELLSDEDGDQEYVVAPLAVNEVGKPLQIAVLGETVITTVVTVIVPWPVDVHPLASVPVTVYVMVDVGFAITVAPVVELKSVAGLQV
jgi:hypothetical protein